MEGDILTIGGEGSPGELEELATNLDGEDALVRQNGRDLGQVVVFVATAAARAGSGGA